jgi:integrase
MSVHKRSYQRKDGSKSLYYLAVVKAKGLQTLTKQFDRKIDAETWEREQRVKITGEPQTTKATGAVTIAELAANWFDTHASKTLEWSSQNRYEINWRRHIEPVFGRTRAMDLGPSVVESWARGLVHETGLTEKSANGCLMLLKKILSDSLRWQLISVNPISGIRPMKEPEKDFNFWTLDEAEKFLRYVDEVDRRFYFGVAVALYTGMRLGEIQALKWDAVDFATRLITVKRTYCLKRGEAKERTKTSRIRRLPISQALTEILVELKNASTGEYVLPDFPFHHASKVMRRLAKEAGVKPIRFHDLRHSFASNFVMRGGQIYKLQRLLGHSSIQMTERYSHLSPDHLQDATEILDFGTLQRGNVTRISDRTSVAG